MGNYALFFNVKRGGNMTKIDWENITNYIESVGTTDTVFPFTKPQSSVKVTASGATANLIYTIGGQSGTLTPGQSVTVTGSITSMTLRAASGRQPFYVWAVEANTEKEEPETGFASLEDVKSLSYGIPMKGKVRKPLITFIDDDNNAQVYTRLKPIFESRGVPCTVAVPSFSVNGEGAMTDTQLLDLQNNLGWEIASHTKNHTDLNTMTEAQLEVELGGSKAELESYGLKCNSIVYPHGQQGDDLGRRISRKYFRSGVTTNSTMKQNTPPLSQFSLGRVAIGSFFDTPNGTYTTTDTLDYYKAAVDQAVANNSWIIFMSHVGATSEAQLSLIGQTIDYIKSLNVDIVTLDKGLDIMGNIIDVGDKQSTTAGYFIVDCNGDVTAKVLGLNNKATVTQYGLATPATSYPLDKITLVVVDTPNATGAPSNNRAGILITNRFTDDTYTYQTYITNNQNITFTRRWVSGAWTEWLKFPLSRPQFTKNIGVTTITAGTIYETIAYYPNVTTTDVVSVSPSGTVEAGLMWNCWCYSNGAVKLRIHNTTAADITTVARDWVFTAIV